MNISEYYSYQAKARGLFTLNDVMKIVSQNTIIYDKIILPWLPKDTNADIYEVACGPGVFLHWLEKKGYKNAKGSDSSDVQISLALEGGLKVKLIDAIEELSTFSDNKLDCLVGLDFYEHLPKEILLDFLQQCSRVLRPGGVLILRGPNGDSPVVGRAFYNDITHHWALTTTAFKALLNMAGFDRTTFCDDTMASIVNQRWIRVPVAWIGQKIYRTLIRVATRENIVYLSSSIFIAGWKKKNDSKSV